MLRVQCGNVVVLLSQCKNPLLNKIGAKAANFKMRCFVKLVYGWSELPSSVPSLGHFHGF